MNSHMLTYFVGVSFSKSTKIKLERIGNNFKIPVEEKLEIFKYLRGIGDMLGFRSDLITCESL